MNQVAHALGKQTIAECVENERTLALLKQIGVDRAQGNYLGHPAENLESVTGKVTQTESVLETV